MASNFRKKSGFWNLGFLELGKMPVLRPCGLSSIEENPTVPILWAFCCSAWDKCMVDIDAKAKKFRRQRKQKVTSNP